MRQVIHTDDAPKALGPYSQGVIIDGMLYTSGQIALNTEGKLVGASVQDQTAQVMTNLQAILAAADATFADVIKATIYLTDVSTFAEMNAAYGRFMMEPYPAREIAGIAALPLGARVEISLIVKVPGNS